MVQELEDRARWPGQLAGLFVKHPSDHVGSTDEAVQREVVGMNTPEAERRQHGFWEVTQVEGDDRAGHPRKRRHHNVTLRLAL